MFDHRIYTRTSADYKLISPYFNFVKQIYYRVTSAVLVWRSGNGVRHINEVKLRRARLVVGLVTTFVGFTIPVFIKATHAHSA